MRQIDTTPPPPLPPGALWQPTEHQRPARPVGRKKTAVLLHFTGGLHDAPALRLLTGELGNAGKRVSAHYLVGREGQVWCLAAPTAVTFHAGITTPAQANEWSIGVEQVNPGFLYDRKGKVRFNPNSWPSGWETDANGQAWAKWGEAQLAATEALLVWLFNPQVTASFGLALSKPTEGGLYGHSDLAPGRKVDPGYLFPMKRMMDAAESAYEVKP